MDRKTRHEQFVTGHNGGPLSQIYALTGVCLLSIVCYHVISRRVPTGFPTFTADFIFTWAIILASLTVYARKLYLLAVILAVTLILGSVGYKEHATRGEKKKAPRVKVGTRYATSEDTGVSKEEATPVGEKVAYRPFITLYRAEMMVLTITAILAVDFSIFPRSFVKTETWGTSLMDLGVGSFVFSMGIVSSRRAYKEENTRLFSALEQSIFQTLKILVLGFVRLASVKLLDYQEHVSEYGVHWNFFFTLGLLPLAFTILNRIRFPGGLLTKAFLLALGYELALKNTGLQEWALWAPRDSFISQNKEGVVSFAGYLSIFAFGYDLGINLMDPKAQFKQMIVNLAKWTAVAQALFMVLRIATEPSRRIANLPYVCWVVAFNAGCLTVFAAMEHFLGVMPSLSYDAVNKNGEIIFVLANLMTGLVNIVFDTLELNAVQSLVVLLGYQAVMMLIALRLNRK